ncbi:hypothetical protein Tco_1329266 [Tanacetum coccineum]
MFEVKKTDHSADVLASIKSQVPTVVDKYLGTKLDDALLRILERHTADLIEKYSVLSGLESTDKVALENLSSFNRTVEDAMDKEVASQGPSAGSKPGSTDSNTIHEHSEQSSNDIPMQDEGHVSDLEVTDNAHIPKVSTTTWFKPIPEDERSATPELEMGLPPRTGKKKLCKADLEGPAFNLVDLVNPEGHQILRNIYEPLPLGGPPGQVTIQPQFFFNRDLDYLLTGDKERKIALSISKLKAARYLDFGLEELVPSLWVESERDYDISAAYGITHWWFRRKEFYINKHSEPSDREAVRSQMRILSVISVKVFEKYGYNYLREIILRRADYQEYKISEKDFKNLHPNDFEDMFLLNIQEKLNHLPKTDKTSPSSALVKSCGLRNPGDYYFKEDYTICPYARIVVVGHMVKDFNLFEITIKGNETRKWSGMTREKAKNSITTIENKGLQDQRSSKSRKLCWRKNKRY